MSLTENEFITLAEAELDLLEQALDQCEADIDYELQPGGILEIEFANRSKIIVNRHAAAKEIWVAAKAGGFHFRLQEELWRDTRDDVELWQRLNTLCSQQAGEAITLTRA